MKTYLKTLLLTLIGLATLAAAPVRAMENNDQDNVSINLTNVCEYVMKISKGIQDVKRDIEALETKRRNKQTNNTQPTAQPHWSLSSILPSRYIIGALSACAVATMVAIYYFWGHNSIPNEETTNEIMGELS